MKPRSTRDAADLACFVGRFRVRAGDGIVTDGEQSQCLEPQVMAVLVYLADHAGRVVSRQELLREVWGGTAVTDGAVTRCIGAIRRALTAGGADDPIRTLPKRGYQLVAPVRFEPAQRRTTSPRPGRPGRRRLALALSVAVAVAVAACGFLWIREHRSQPTVVVVEDFQDLDPLSRQEAWGRSLAEEVTAKLLATPGLTVAPRGAAAPGPDAVLAGSVRREGDSARVSCRLTDTRTSEVRCARTCTTPAAPRLETQEHIAGGIAAGVREALD